MQSTGAARLNGLQQPVLFITETIMNKEHLKEVFEENDVAGMWDKLYDLPEFDVTFILDDCCRRADKISTADDQTPMELRFCDMVYGWE